MEATGTLSAIAAKKKSPQLPAVSPALARSVWEGMSNPVPVGSPRKSAAIIPFLNKTLASGLPIGSGRNWFNDLGTLAAHISPRAGGDRDSGWHQLAVEVGELAQRVSVGDPLAQLAVIQVLDPHQDQRAQHLLRGQSVATGVGVLRLRRRSPRIASIISSWSS